MVVGAKAEMFLNYNIIDGSCFSAGRRLVVSGAAASETPLCSSS